MSDVSESIPRNKLRSSGWFLLAANLIPVAGVLLFDWHVFDILMLYWVENVIIGAVNVLRMAACKPVPGADVLQRAIETAPAAQRKVLTRLNAGAPWFLIPFFVLHYGVFCYAHLSAVLLLFGHDQASMSAQELFFGLPFAEAVVSPLWIGIIAIAASHSFSFITNFIGAGEYQRTSLMQLMQRPYGRIIALHVAIVIGGALIQFFGAPVYMLLVLVIAKTALDLKFHNSERRKFGDFDLS